MTAPRRPLRVVHCPVNTAGVPWTNVQALRRRGSTPRSSSSTATRSTRRRTARSSSTAGSCAASSPSGRSLAELLPRTDLFHFTFGLTLVPQSLQFPILRAFRKRSVMHYLGSDIRGKTPEELAYGKKAGAEIVGSYDAIRWVPEATVIPPGIDLAAVTPAPPSGRRRPVVVHAPSSRRRKGTDHVVAACEDLDVELRIVEGLHHDEAFERYRDADIVVDQLNAGWYGLFAIECMALGKPVVTFLHDEAVARTEEAFGLPVPIVNASSRDAARPARGARRRCGPSARERSGAPRARTSSASTTSTASPTRCSTCTRPSLEPAARAARHGRRRLAGAGRPAVGAPARRTTELDSADPDRPRARRRRARRGAGRARRASSGGSGATPRSTGSAGSCRA